MNAVHDLVAGKSVTLLGSAPGAALDGHASDLLVCVNGAALVLPAAVIPDILILNTGVALAPQAGQATRPRLHELRTRLMVVVESGTSLAQALPVFAPVQRDSERHITLGERSAFLEAFFARPLTAPSGSQHVPSTGLFACLLLLAGGAHAVHMKGFSFGDGHSYFDEVFKRGHVEIDREVLRILLQRGMPVYCDRLSLPESLR